MEALEKAVRDAAETLQQAVDKAVAAGYVIVFPQAAGLPITALAISETAKRAKVTNLDGSPLPIGPDGVIQGESLLLTDEERAALPPLDQSSSNDPATFVSGEARKSK